MLFVPRRRLKHDGWISGVISRTVWRRRVLDGKVIEQYSMIGCKYKTVNPFELTVGRRAWHRQKDNG